VPILQVSVVTANRCYFCLFLNLFKQGCLLPDMKSSMVGNY